MERELRSSGTSPMTRSSPGTSESKTSPRSAPSGSPGDLDPLQASVTAAFFAFVGNSPSPITDIFSRSFMQTYLKTSIPVRAVVTTIGNICLEVQRHPDLRSRMSAAAAVMEKDRNMLNRFLEHLVAPDSHDQHIMLLYGILKIYAELMSSETWVCSRATFVRLAAKVRKQLEQRRRRPLLYFDKGLLMHFSLLGAIYSLLSFGDSFLVNFEFYDPSPFENVKSLTGHIRINSAIFHHFTQFLTHFARLHHRAFNWVHEARSALNDKHLTGEVSEAESREILIAAGLMQKGTEIISSSASAMNSVERLRGVGYNDNDDDGESKSTDFCTLREAYYHYALMALTRAFCDPVWNLVAEDLPRFICMPELEAYGELVRERIAQRMSGVGMEAWSYLFILIGVGMASRTPRNRRVLRELFYSGFASVEAFLADLRLIWGEEYNGAHYA
ncbi:uncharacterized protein LY79DRAFT_647573 [Colletotrichum navitas]|uniref:Uncharacterized protein n=1 Tax=Colletotrichum navitas TaxID=681940 RepID=A0AAD8Q8K1_9PEZI|nr:uncharacterized protein LY79DRAFT_647573 [Colletotrichum navitas]KAK1596564.1 hypothetical protein LY79DRAFT_647573 [Colletotrichum navitas]